MSTAGLAGNRPERRRERRVSVRLQVRVRGTDSQGVPFEEITESKDVCRTGAAFRILHELNPGADLDITIPLPKQGREAEADFATRGRIVHIAPGEREREKIVGVEFVGPRFHRIFQSESGA